MKTNELLKKLEELIRSSFATYNSNRDIQVASIIKQLEKNE